MRFRNFLAATGSMMAFTGFRPIRNDAPLPIHPLDRFHPRIRALILSACQHTPTKSPINADGVRIVKAQVKRDFKADALRMSRGIAHA